MTLSPQTAADLVQLKVLKDLAINTATLSSAVSRLTAVVLLDAANERAMHLVGAEVGAHLGDRDRFEQVMAHVASALGSRWTREGWPDVRKLHRSRNLAQHEGLSSDRDHLAGWTAATQLFVGTLVQVGFDVNLDEVRLSSAIMRQEIAELMALAEDALSNEDPAEAVKRADEAFGKARGEWARTRPEGAAAHRPMKNWREPESRTGLWAADQVEALREAALDAAFVGDQAEYLWYRSLRSDKSVPPTIDEAQRALSFVFWWIVRWEAFAQTYVPDRARTRMRQARTVRTGDGPARVAGGSLELGHEDLVLHARLVDVPSDESFYAWSAAVQNRLNGVHQFPYIDESGTLRLHLPPDANAGEVAARIRDALRDAETDVAAAVLQAEQREKDRGDRNEEYVKQFDAMTLPPDVHILGLRENHAAPHSVALKIPANYDMMLFCELMRAAESVDQCYGSADGVCIEPALEPSTLVTLLWEVHQQLLPAVEAAVRTAEERDQVRRRLERELLSRLQELQ